MGKKDICFKVDELIDYGVDQYHFILKNPKQKTQLYSALDLAQAIRQEYGTETPITAAIIGALETTPHSILRVQNW